MSRQSNEGKEDTVQKVAGVAPAKSLSINSMTDSHQQNSLRQDENKTNSKELERPPTQYSRETRRDSKNSYQGNKDTTRGGDTLHNENDISNAKSDPNLKREMEKECEVVSCKGGRTSSLSLMDKRPIKLLGEDKLQEENGSVLMTDVISQHTASFNDESVCNYSTIDFRPHDYDKAVLDARAVLHTRLQPCSCYPRTSTGSVPSMMYDQIRCVHHGHIGYSHLGVSNFNDGWSVQHELNVRPKTQKLEKRSYFRGYPKPLLNSVESHSPSSLSKVLKSENISLDMTDVSRESLKASFISRHESQKDKTDHQPATLSKLQSSHIQVTRSQSTIKNHTLPETSPEQANSVSTSGHSLASDDKKMSTPVTVSRSKADSDSAYSKINRKLSNISLATNDGKNRPMITPIDVESRISCHTSVQSPADKKADRNRPFVGEYYDPAVTFRRHLTQQARTNLVSDFCKK